MNYSLQEEIEDLKRDYKYLKDNVEALPGLIERGHQFIYPERYEEWEKDVYLHVLKGYGAFVVEDALDIMEVLDSNDDMEKAFDLLKERDQYHSGGSIGAVTKLIMNYSKRGPEFCEMIDADRMTPQYQERINARKAENAKLAEKSANIKL